MIYNEITKNEEGEREVKVFTDDKKRCIVKLVNVECIELETHHMYIKVSGEDNQAKINEFDDSNMKEASENCEKWFGRKIPGPTIEKAYHTDSFDRFSLELITETKTIEIGMKTTWMILTVIHPTGNVNLVLLMLTVLAIVVGKM